MANGELINQVDELLQLDKISPSAATTLTLKLLKGIYETQQEHGRRLTALEMAGRVDEAQRDRFVTWPWIRDAFSHPIFMMVVGAVIAFIAAKFGGG